MWGELVRANPGQAVDSKFPVSEREVRAVRERLGELDSYRSRTLRDLYDAAIDYDQAQGDACVHLLAFYRKLEPPLS